MKTIKKMLSESLAQNKANYAQHLEVQSILNAVDGKEINKRTFNDKIRNGFKLTFSAGMYNLEKNGMKHLISYNGFVTASKFYEYDCCHSSGSLTRIENIEDMDVVLLTKKYNAIKKHFNAIRDLFGDLDSLDLDSFKNPIYYEMLDSIHKGTDRSIRLSDFHFIRTFKAVK